jgi:nitrogen-specific signal transduction histidine kinase/CheY-like chemotaxis protein
VDTNTVLITWEGRPATLNFLRDISEQREVEKQLRHAQKMEAIGTLAGGIAHDFNNLLQAIQGYAELLLLDRAKDDKDYAELREIAGAAGRGGDLTGRLLTFGRKVESKRRPLDINRQLTQIRKLLVRTIPKMINIELRLDEKLDTVNADPTQIEQALMNLAVNAKDAMSEGGSLVIETKNSALDEDFCRIHSGIEPGDYVLISVSDTGCGMDKDTLEHIFEPFYSTKELGGGTGLGLAMVYGIVKSHDGHIACHSEPGEGTTFGIHLPAIESFEETAEVEVTDIPRRGTESILVVDDDESIARFGRRILEKHGYTVHSAVDGESALELYRKEGQQIDLIVLDLIMPGMGGRKCLEQLLEMNPDVKVIIASGLSDTAPVNEVQKAGARSFVGKPFEIRQMLEVVREVLDEN